MDGLSAIIGKKQAASRSLGFTLLELLVTIGIIVILIGILLPAMSGMRRAAKNTSTRNLIQSIETAISQYQNDQRGEVPGPWTEEDRLGTSSNTWNAIRNSNGFSPGLQSHVPKPGGGSQVDDCSPTRSEELLMCLMGGIVLQRDNSPPFDVAGPDFYYKTEELDRGHINMGLKNRSHMSAYMTGSRNRSDDKALKPQFGRDTVVPEFVDDYGMPILYARAYKGQNTTTAYYNYDLTSPRPDVIDLKKGQLGLEAVRYYATDVDAKANIMIPPSYVESENVTSAADPKPTRQQDRYILISAGADKKFGTADDVTNFGSPKLPSKVP